MFLFRLPIVGRVLRYFFGKKDAVVPMIEDIPLTIRIPNDSDYVIVQNLWDIPTPMGIRKILK